MFECQRLEVDWELSERTRVAHQPSLSLVDLDRCVVPHRGSHAADLKAPLEHVLNRQLQDIVRRAPEDRHRGRVPVGGQHGERLDHEVERMRVRRQRGEGEDGAGALKQDVRSPEVVRHGGGAPSGQVGPASEAEVERLKPPRSIEERRGGVVAVCGREGGLPSKERGSRALEVVEWPALCHGQEPLRGLELARLQTRLCRGQRAACLQHRVRGQRARPLEERRRGHEAAAASRLSCGALEVAGDGLVRSGGRESAVPGALVGGEFGVAHLRQRVVDATSFVE